MLCTKECNNVIPVQGLYKKGVVIKNSRIISLIRTSVAPKRHLVLIGILEEWCHLFSPGGQTKSRLG